MDHSQLPPENGGTSTTATRELSLSHGAIELDEATAERVDRISALQNCQPEDVVRVAVEVLDSMMQMSLAGWAHYASNGDVARKVVIFP